VDGFFSFFLSFFLFFFFFKFSLLRPAVTSSFLAELQLHPTLLHAPGIGTRDAILTAYIDFHPISITIRVHGARLGALARCIIIHRRCLPPFLLFNQYCCGGFVRYGYVTPYPIVPVQSSTFHPFLLLLPFSPGLTKSRRATSDHLLICHAASFAPLLFLKNPLFLIYSSLLYLFLLRSGCLKVFATDSLLELQKKKESLGCRDSRLFTTTGSCPLGERRL
jgi:hypothetical protein